MIPESYFDKPYWVIDVLPEQVSKNSPGQYFAVEEYWLQPMNQAALRRRFADLLLKLNCYHGFHVYSANETDYGQNPAPDSLISLVCSEQVDLCIVLTDSNAMITLNRDDTYMTVYNHRKSLCKLIERLSFSEGLFLRKPLR
ncbi:MAG: hypothetical protein IKS78_05530 [Clostridia bacterium]|nr:hypothetical protein [Clostridia bacterium]